MKSTYINSIVLSLIISLLSCDQPDTESPLEINFNSRAYVSLEIFNISSARNFKFSYLPRLYPRRRETPEYNINSDTTIVVELITNMPQEFDFDLIDLQIPFFSVPNDTVHISIDLKNGDINYSGINQNINRYLLSKTKIQRKIDARRSEIYNDESLSYSEFCSNLDSVSKVERKIIDTTTLDLPN